jgi:hypothetical protein
MKGPPSPPSSLPFPYSAMWLAHECQTTWQNMEMDTGKFRIYRILKGGIDTSPVEKICFYKSGTFSFHYRDKKVIRILNLNTNLQLNLFYSYFSI